MANFGNKTRADDELDLAVLADWEAGMSAEVIAARNPPYTRNAVLGLLRRIDMADPGALTRKRQPTGRRT